VTDPADTRSESLECARRFTGSVHPGFLKGEKVKRRRSFARKGERRETNVSGLLLIDILAFQCYIIKDLDNEGQS